MVGDVESVTASFRELADMGYAEVVVRNIVTEQSQAVACIERLGEVRAALATPAE